MTYFLAPDGTVVVNDVDYTGNTDETQKFQDAINYAWQSFGGGIVKPYRPGIYRTRHVFIRGSVILQGHGRMNTLFGSHDIDEGKFTLMNEVTQGGLRDLFVIGAMDNPTNSNAVTINENVPALIERCNIWGGNSAVYNKGFDGRFTDVFMSGFGLACLLSNGANWYRDCKLDHTTMETQHCDYSFYQGVPLQPPGPGVRENTFEGCDFSGPWNVASVKIEDGGTNTAQTVFTAAVFSSPIQIANHFSTLFAGCRFGSPSFSIKPTQAQLATVVGSHYYGPGSMTLPTGVIRAGNIGIN